VRNAVAGGSVDLSLERADPVCAGDDGAVEDEHGSAGSVGEEAEGTAQLSGARVPGGSGGERERGVSRLAVWGGGGEVVCGVSSQSSTASLGLGLLIRIGTSYHDRNSGFRFASSGAILVSPPGGLSPGTQPLP